MYKKLAETALAIRMNAVPPYSNFHVGAALLTDDDEIITGCNIENSSFGLTMCAERVAIFKAMSEGKRKFKAIAIASDDPGFCPPCGACRQLIVDHLGEVDIILTNHNLDLKIYKSSELLPLAFTKEFLDDK